MERRQIAGVGNWNRLKTLALFGAVAVVAAGCTAAVREGGDRAVAGGAPVVLRLANYSNSLDFEPAVADFVTRVGEISGGNVRIEVISNWGGLGLSPGVEQQVVRDVAAGKADLAWVGTRVFDTMGVESFQALTGPMLIDSYPLERAVIVSDMPGQMLKSLDKLRVTGLALLADGLRKPIAVERPLLGPADWRGISFAASRSQGHAAAIQALGARASDLWGGQLTAALDAGTVGGFEKSLLIYQALGLKTQAPYVTANVNLWPQVVTLLANPDHLAELTDAQRGWLQQAAREASTASTGLVEHEDQVVTELCQGGARLSNASEADLAALRQAFVPVYDTLEKDPPTKDFIARIEALKGSTAAGAPLAIPAGCTGQAPGSGSGGQTAEDPVAGMTAKLTESQIVRAFVTAGGSEKEGHAFFSQLGVGSEHDAVITLVFKGGVFDEYESGDGGPQVNGYHARYEGGDDGVLTLSGGDCTEGATYRYNVSGDVLRLQTVTQCSSHDAPYNTTLFATFPFTRSS